MTKKVVKKQVTGKPVISEGDFSQASDGCNGNRIFIALAKTVNLGNYESIRVEYGQGRTVQKGESFKQVREKLLKESVPILAEIIEQVEEELS